VAVVLAVLINAVSKFSKLFKVTDAGPQELFPVASAVMPAMPERTVPRVLEPGVLREEILLASSTRTLPGHSGKLWLYLPQGRHEPKSLPCVLIAPAGTPLVIGMDLGDGDVPEH